MKRIAWWIGAVLAVTALGGGCAPSIPLRSRAETIPKETVKMTPGRDLLPPILHSNEWTKPVPLPAPVNSAGAEDSPFITPDGNTFYFFFTPDPNIPPEGQLTDGVTGIWSSEKTGDGWSEPKRVILMKGSDLSLDGCEFVQGDTMWFCSARKGNYRDIDMYTARFRNGTWTDWKNAGEKLNEEYRIGEMHVTADGNKLYFHADRPGGKGQVDVWVTRLVNGEWQEPENVAVVNTGETEGWPFVSEDGNELWFLRTYKGSPSIWRSKKKDGTWSKPELIVSQFAGEPSLDRQGNLYFTHHYYKDGKMLEADIYVARRKP
ncbi:hypothetical protein A3E39_03875 [Candidatus Uhrbacteria bacterium RIFCSPHIGHO2_12_FULL_60_25]|uniref:Uncharacterized protein n=1 Tax=Candidatus Uhrbacteria bacterium RIFCSPHIGHO2_12_FULL_60_25 TaxID=1802399 RepID=A0A1F7UJ18_9BACT|nr:MAG: hypothetical protein A3E39_03875 [Candidatus Uhrbacteria bacterium RIFCSPHIGHO2_12_FULL_60_25]